MFHRYWYNTGICDNRIRACSFHYNHPGGCDAVQLQYTVYLRFAVLGTIWAQISTQILHVSFRDDRLYYPNCLFKFYLLVIITCITSTILVDCRWYKLMYVTLTSRWYKLMYVTLTSRWYKLMYVTLTSRWYKLMYVTLTSRWYKLMYVTLTSRWYKLMYVTLTSRWYKLMYVTLTSLLNSQL